MSRDNNVRFSDFSTTHQDQQLEGLVSANQQDNVIDLFDYAVQEAYDQGYDGKDFVKSSELPKSSLPMIAEVDHNLVLELLNEVEEVAFEQGQGDKQDDGEDDEESNDEDDDSEG